MKKNIEQEKAIAQLEGPVILISCPGSGKTTTLLRRINHMLEVGIPPKKILMITFTKAAAQEMSVKFKKKFGEPNGITFSTIHALCLKILMTYGGLSAENIIKTSDQWKFLLETARKCQSVCDPAKAAGNFQMLYSAAMNLNNNNDQGVCLSTMHRSKGLEWKNVYIIDCNEGYIPPGSPDTPISQEEVEEERRLFYVAVTRAKERLFITYVGNKKGKPVSRFVRELQLKESGRAKTVKKNDMVRHKTYGVCMVLSVNGSKCTIRSLSDDRDAEVLVSSLDIR